MKVSNNFLDNRLHNLRNGKKKKKKKRERERKRKIKLLLNVLITIAWIHSTVL